jgi:hypothetical protein
MDGIASVKEEEVVGDRVDDIDVCSRMTPGTQSQPIDKPDEQDKGQFEISLETQIQDPGQKSFGLVSGGQTEEITV